MNNLTPWEKQEIVRRSLVAAIVYSVVLLVFPPHSFKFTLIAAVLLFIANLLSNKSEFLLWQKGLTPNKTMYFCALFAGIIMVIYLSSFSTSSQLIILAGFLTIRAVESTGNSYLLLTTDNEKGGKDNG